jgi:hypothetical protein
MDGKVTVDKIAKEEMEGARGKKKYRGKRILYCNRKMFPTLDLFI